MRDDTSTVTGQQDYILVPRKPSAEMLYAAADAALAEDAAAVWEEMIGEYERSLEQPELTER
jgi:hypothetical protein